MSRVSIVCDPYSAVVKGMARILERLPERYQYIRIEANESLTTVLYHVHFTDGGFEYEIAIPTEFYTDIGVGNGQQFKQYVAQACAKATLTQVRQALGVTP